VAPNKLSKPILVSRGVHKIFSTPRKPAARFKRSNEADRLWDIRVMLQTIQDELYGQPSEEDPGYPSDDICSGAAQKTDEKILPHAWQYT
jgi:hypothetical protein